MVPMRTSVTASEAMKKLVGCRIWRSTTKLTRTRRLPKVVTTMQMARLTAMKMVSREPKGAGQHSGPQGVPYVPGMMIGALGLYPVVYIRDEVFQSHGNTCLSLSHDVASSSHFP